MASIRFLLAATVPLLLASCATYAPRELHAGQGEDEVLRQLGPPTGRYALANGTARLEFARGPFGKVTYMVDLDAQGRVLQWQQVLTEENFNRVLAGEPREQLLRELGRPSQTRPGGWQGGQVWSWRYDPQWICQWFQVSLDDAGVVASTAYATDPHCDPGDQRQPP